MLERILHFILTQHFPYNPTLWRMNFYCEITTKDFLQLPFKGEVRGGWYGMMRLQRRISCNSCFSKARCEAFYKVTDFSQVSHSSFSFKYLVQGPRHQAQHLNLTYIYRSFNLQYPCLNPKFFSISFMKFHLVYYVLPFALASPLVPRYTPCSPESMVDDEVSLFIPYKQK